MTQWYVLDPLRDGEEIRKWEYLVIPGTFVYHNGREQPFLWRSVHHGSPICDGEETFGPRDWGIVLSHMCRGIHDERIIYVQLLLNGGRVRWVNECSLRRSGRHWSDPPKNGEGKHTLNNSGGS